MCGCLRTDSLSVAYGFAPGLNTRLYRRCFSRLPWLQTLTRLRLISHLSVGIMIGLLYLGIGNESSKAFNNAGCLFFCMLFLMFTALMPTVMTCEYSRGPLSTSLDPSVLIL